MTREEARQVLQEKIDNSPLFKEERESFTMAIEALSNNITESPNDVIESQDDVIEVVRCNDCCNLYNKDFCSFFGSPTDAMDYCSHGERREE